MWFEYNIKSPNLKAVYNIQIFENDKGENCLVQVKFVATRLLMASDVYDVNVKID